MENIDLSKYQEDIETYISHREILIKISRDVLRSSKVLIFTLHRGEFDVAKELYDGLLVEKKELDSIVKNHDKLQFEGSYSEACQEYIEALALFEILLNKKVLEKPNDVSTMDYLLGLCDLTGEISRHVVHLAIERKKDDIKFYYIVVDSMMGEFVKFNLKNGQLRQKYDSIKYNLKKIENIMYDLSLKD